MAKQQSKIALIPFANLLMSKRNFRAHTHDRLIGDGEILQTLPVDGQRVPIVTWHRKPTPQELLDNPKLTVDKHGMISEILCGHRRAYSVEYAAKLGIENPKTRKFDEQGKQIEGSGEVFSYLESYIWEGDFTDTEIEAVMNDNTGERLTEIEAINALVAAYQKYGSETRALEAVYGVLVMDHWRDSGKATAAKISALSATLTETQRIAEVRKINIARCHGRFLVATHAMLGATVVKQAYLAKLAGQQAWLTDKEIHTLYTLFNRDYADNGQTDGHNRLATWQAAKAAINPDAKKEGKDDWKALEIIKGPDGKETLKYPTPVNADYSISVDKPGPRFMEKWEEILEAVRRGDEAGKPAASTNAKSPTQINGLIQQIPGQSLTKLVLLWAINKIDTDTLAGVTKAHDDFLLGTIDVNAYKTTIAKAFATLQAPAAS